MPHSPSTVARQRFFSYSEAMEVHFNPETEKKLKERADGRRTDDLVEDAMAGYFDEVLQAREMLDSRYDDLKSGKVKPISRDEVIAHFREKSASRRQASIFVITNGL